jgi:hypothetical protein
VGITVGSEAVPGRKGIIIIIIILTHSLPAAQSFFRS